MDSFHCLKTTVKGQQSCQTHIKSCYETSGGKTQHSPWGFTYVPNSSSVTVSAIPDCVADSSHFINSCGTYAYKRVPAYELRIQSCARFMQVKSELRAICRGQTTLPLLPLTETVKEQVSTRETSAKYILPTNVWLLTSLSGIRVMTISNIQMRGHRKCFKETQSYHYLHIPDFCSAANTLMQARKEECDVGKEAVYNLSLLCRHALRRELC